MVLKMVVGAAWYSVSLGGPVIPPKPQQWQVPHLPLLRFWGGHSILEGPTFLWGDLEPLCTPWNLTD